LHACEKTLKLAGLTNEITPIPGLGYGKGAFGFDPVV
jgi:hypothetical protein